MLEQLYKCDCVIDDIKAEAEDAIVASHEALRAALAAQTAEVQALTVQLTEAREARQRAEQRHEEVVVRLRNEADARVTEARGQVIAEIEAYLDAQYKPDSATVWAGPLRNKLTGMRLATLDTRREGE